ncbi:MAG: DUF4258 domain-containing protein [Hydrogenophaga sp.]|uniref:DUF4258 domain-containing protein n=1 Tax=Hydrogenophaga sp. TaxID=1904254 RepID=UPI002AB8F862|nr:DUF4258 domain-containing protein [Hydrogenophaga sp.]MDZ4188156.1 DUF4258 domain-containing protein [Hydrogenophaga sp.]
MPVVLTEHAKQRMQKRGMDEGLVLEIIDTGIQKDAGNGHFWIYKNFEHRQDNLLCVAVVIENVMVVKTIMHHWENTP